MTEKEKEKANKLDKVVFVLHENHNGELSFYLITEDVWKRANISIQLHTEKDDEEGCKGGKHCPHNIAKKEHKRGGVKAVLEKWSYRSYNFWADDHEYNMSSNDQIVHIVRISERL